MRPHGRGTAPLCRVITCGWPTAFNTLLRQFPRFRRTINSMVVTGSGSLWRVVLFLDRGPWFTPCVARCQTNLEHGYMSKCKRSKIRSLVL